MKQSLRLTLGLTGLAIAVATNLDTQALPVAAGGPLAGTGDGLNSKWVAVDTGLVANPHNLADAENILALNSGDTGVTGFFEGVVPTINHSDSTQLVAGDHFAIRYFGFLNITRPGSYAFGSYHDDGVRVRIGGDTSIVYNGDTSPTFTYSPTYDLQPGLYPIEVVTWEQGGQFASQLFWKVNGSNQEIVPQAVLFSSNPVPEGGSSLALFSIGAGLLVFRRFGKP